MSKSHSSAPILLCTWGATDRLLAAFCKPRCRYRVPSEAVSFVDHQTQVLQCSFMPRWWKTASFKAACRFWFLLLASFLFLLLKSGPQGRPPRHWEKNKNQLPHFAELTTVTIEQCRICRFCWVFFFGCRFLFCWGFFLSFSAWAVLTWSFENGVFFTIPE